MEKVRYFWIEAAVVQIFAIVFALVTFLSLQEGESIFRDVKEFTPVNALCTKSERHNEYDSTDERWETRYTNYYLYEVDGNIYRVTYYDQSSDGYGRSKTIYYNPKNPSVNSLYPSLAAYKANKMMGYLGAVILEIFAIIGFSVSIYRKRTQNLLAKSKGRVIYDDFDPGLPDGHTDDMQTEENDTEILTIPFRRTQDSRSDSSEERQQYDPWERNSLQNRNQKKKNEEFVLYTEDEYKKIKRQ